MWAVCIRARPPGRVWWISWSAGDGEQWPWIVRVHQRWHFRSVSHWSILVYIGWWLRFADENQVRSAFCEQPISMRFFRKRAWCDWGKGHANHRPILCSVSMFKQFAASTPIISNLCSVKHLNCRAVRAVWSSSEMPGIDDARNVARILLALWQNGVVAWQFAASGLPQW